MRTHRLAAALLAASPSILAGAVFAQAADVDPIQQSEPAATQIDDIIVQARRTDERQQDVPIAVSTVSADQLTDAAVSSVADIQKLVPSLQVAQGTTGQLDFTIRGAFAGFGVDPSVVTYIDEVPIDPRTLAYGLFDLRSVEQLKGPQGTLFGRNSTGGAVLFSSARPSFGGAGGYLSLRTGNLGERRAEGAFTAALNDSLAFRIAGQIERRDGTLESVTAPGLEYDNRHNEALRASLLWTPTDRIENYTQLTHYRVREHRSPNVALTLAGPCTGPTTPAAACLFQPPFSTILGTDNLRAWFDQQQLLGEGLTVGNDPATDDVDRDSITNTLTVDFGGVTVRNTSYYGETDIGLTRDFDGTPARVVTGTQDDKTRTFYNETQIYGRALQDRLDWRLGAVYNRDDGDSVGYQAVFPFPVSLVTPRLNLSATDFKSTAVFGQATYDLSALLSGLSVTAGYRYTWDDREISTQSFSGQPTQVCALQQLPVPGSGPVPFPDVDLATCTRELHAKYEDDNYNLTVSWKPRDSLLLYAATRKGYKTGSFNSVTIDPLLAQYQPEVVEDVEIGLKADWRLGDVPMRTNIAAFTSAYDNVQTSLTLVDPVSGSITVVTLNADTVTGAANAATIKGFEVELTALPTDWLKLNAFYSRVDATYDRFFSVGPRVDLSGQNVGGVIPETAGVTGQFDLPLSGPFDALELTASYYWRAARLTNASASLTAPPGESTRSIDVRAALTNVFGTGAEISAFGKNLSDERDCESNTVVSGEVTERCFAARTYGLELRYRFGSEGS